MAVDQALEAVWRPPSSGFDASHAAAEAAAADLARHHWPTDPGYPARFPPMPALSAAAVAGAAAAGSGAGAGAAVESGEGGSGGGGRPLNAGVFSTYGARGPDKMEDRHVIARELCGIPGAHLVGGAVT